MVPDSGGALMMVGTADDAIAADQMTQLGAVR